MEGKPHPLYQFSDISTQCLIIQDDKKGGTAGYSPHLILSTAGFSKVSNRRKFRVNGTSIKPAIVELTDCFLCILLAIKLNTFTAHKMPTCAI